jgi:hypothetical protein
MKANYTHIAMLLDRSGSMGSIKDYIIEGFNSFITEQKKVPGELTVTLVQFDDDGYDILHDFKNINDFPLLTDAIYIPRGMTPLNDSWVRLIEETGARLSAMKEEDRPEKVLLASLTDGLENKSEKYAPNNGGNEFIKNLVEHQEQVYNWKFIYIGANQDSREEGLKRGVKNFMNFNANKLSVSSTFSSLSSDTATYRSSKENTFNVKRDH